VETSRPEPDGGAGSPAAGGGPEAGPAIPKPSAGALFARFLRFGALAWGGPIAQIAMIKRELVDEERWISQERFNRAYAVYQMLPGPEAHELCVYFGTLARGRLGGLLAGLAFLLPGLVLMLALSWFYVRFGLESASFAAVFAGIQAGVLALVIRAVPRIASHAVSDAFLFAIAVAAAAASLAGTHFAVTLGAAGLLYGVLVRRRWVLAAAVVLLGVAIAWMLADGAATVPDRARPAAGLAATAPELLAIFWSGLRTGLLTFGGAYTAIPLLLGDAVDAHGWLSREQFLDGVALGGVLPAPLIIFGTFVGWLAGGFPGAMALTAGMFLPAFGFTMLGHEHLERLTRRPAIGRFLAGVMAGVVGLVAATAVILAPSCLRDWRSWTVFAASLLLLLAWKAKWAVAAVIGLAGAAGWALR
jgi:chromate transporter